MHLPHPLPDELAELIARRFRALADPLRVRIIDLLRDGELSVGAIASELGAGQRNVSKHLSVLVESGTLARRKEGTSAYYRIADERVLALCEQVCGSIEAQLAALHTLVGRRA